ncbi:TIGR04283 family arsenosugar biosynthesis glycosyltransferase [Tunicatimonas pelagia]|uniref:TIGR04283 family arsenosugar biosynthesis glycosyltransferase n=1 Tax=Tunicatimonas pelagia TaxID=931531 RepID=UPI002666867A|nr:TIGR04283 family arsenosugar biosynthesis glycosyltransferase [Tunicatimonas pelagia]WKN40965.1 TIGR04283 family arsenosugar biosynthesis glycosyltransferase [Tunicatimonas pelagia]
MKISVIIPTYNEAENIGGLVHHLLNNRNRFLAEVIVCDGGSPDDTVAKAEAAGANVLHSPQKGRATQMNHAASQARGDVLYFVHADTLPPQNYLRNISNYVQQGYTSGSYRSHFEDEHPLLKINEFFTRFNWITCRGGDQTLFVTRCHFEQLGGYDEYYTVMEDFDFIRRSRKTGKFVVMPDATLISARKYRDNHYLRVNVANGIVFLMYRLGFSPGTLLNTYKKMVHYPRYSANPKAVVERKL